MFGGVNPAQMKWMMSASKFSTKIFGKNFSFRKITDSIFSRDVTPEKMTLNDWGNL
jgi:hypothetical protein